MVGFRPSVGLAYTGQYCATQAQRVSVARLLRGVIPGNIGAMVRAINGTTAILCDELDDITEDDLAPVPFEGGQCDGVCYSTAIRRTTGDQTALLGRAHGPILGVRSVPISNGVRGEILSRSYITGQLSSCTTLGSLEWRSFTVTADMSAEWNIEVTSVLGQPGVPIDQCGSPPPQFPEPLEPLPLPPIDFTWENNEGVTINATANITLAPAISIGGNISFPVDIEIGDLTFNGNFNLDGSFEFSPTVNINPPGSPPTIGPSLPGDSPALPDESQSVLAGVAITVQSFGPAVTVINAIGAPNLAVPRAASVNFLIDVEGDQFWSSDLDAKNGDCFVPCPPDVVCVDAAVTPYPGVALTWNRVYREERIPPGE